MSCLDSQKIREQLKSKLGCKEVTGKDHYFYILLDDDGKMLSRTKVSLGSRYDVGPALIGMMTRQIRLATAGHFVGMVSCTKTREECLAIIRSQCL
jgi:hypothetical protein